MKSITKSLLLTMLCCFVWSQYLSLAEARGKEANIVLRFAGTLTEKHTITKAQYRFAESVKKKTGGRVVIEVYPAQQLYRDVDLVTALPSGAVEMACPNVGQWVGLVPSLVAIQLCGTYRTTEHFWRCEDGELGKLIAEDLKKKANCRLISFMSLGPNDIIGCSKKQIKTLEDFRGLKIRGATRGHVIFLSAMAAVPTSISSSEVYVALQRGTIDGAVSVAKSFLARGWYEVCPYLTRFMLIPDAPFAILVNLDVWKKLPSDVQQIIVESAREARDWNRHQTVRENDKAWEALAQKETVHIYQVPVQEQERWRAMVRESNMKYLKERVGEQKAKLITELIEKGL